MSKPRAAEEGGTPHEDELGRALKAVRSAMKAREKAERAELEAVRAARAAGASWTKVGELYGLTKQGAQQRFKQPKEAVAPEPSAAAQ